MIRQPSHAKAIPTVYDGVKYRSRVEARWKLFFDAVGIRAHYEAEGYVIRDGVGYLPDFWLPQFRMFFEVKGAEPTADELSKCEDLATVAECDVLIASGPPEARFQLRWCGVDDWHGGPFVLAHDRFADAGFWLVSERDEESFCLGPGKSVHPRGGPMLTYVEPAYEIANSARFEARVQRPRQIVFPYDTHGIWEKDEAA